LRDLLTNETDLRRLKALGYNKLVLVSESPAWFRRHCGQSWQPGQTGFIPANLSPNGGSLARDLSLGRHSNQGYPPTSNDSDAAATPTPALLQWIFFQPGQLSGDFQRETGLFVR